MHPYETFQASFGLTSKAPTLKGVKQDILDELGFFVHGMYDEKKAIIQSSSPGAAGTLYQYVKDQVAARRRVVVLRLDHKDNRQGKGKRGGTGFPVTKIWSEDDLESSFRVDADGNVHQIALSNGWNALDGADGEIYQIYSEPFSQKVKLYPEDSNKADEALGEEILCGGGMRLQLNTDIPGGGYVVDADIILQDKTPRELENNVRDPKFHKRYFLELNKEGKLSVRNAIPGQNLSVNGKYYGSEIMDRLMQVLIENYGTSMDVLFDALMTLHPASDLHSIEVLFGLQSGELRTKVIDIDGFDTVFLWKEQHNLLDRPPAIVDKPERTSIFSDATVRLARAHHMIVQPERLNVIGEQMFTRVQQLLTEQLPGNASWDRTVSLIAGRVKGNCSFQKWWYGKDEGAWRLISAFSRELSEEHKLALFCRNINLWKPDETQDISIHTSTIGDGGLRMITIDMFGYGMSFIVENNELKDLSEYGQPHAVYKKVAALTHNQFVPILVNQFHEGD